MVMSSGIYQTPVERALEAASLPELERLLNVASPWDVSGASDSMLAALAETLLAAAWSGSIASREERERTVRSAVLLHRYRGTPAALREFADLAGFAIFWNFSRDGGRNRGIDIYVTPSVFADADAEWVERITSVLGRLLPYWLTINFISVVPSVDGSVHVGGAYTVKDFVTIGTPA